MIGRKLRNRYLIREHLGDGSTATVYKALDERLGREVAIKLLLPHVRESTRKRFFQEATAAAQLNHPNIMAIYDIDEDGGRHFLVTEFLEGVTLARYIPSEPASVVNIGVQIARALQYAHERQIIHRDIKPANVTVRPDGRVKIMDLGLALPHDAKRVTADGMVIGTPAYLSPEQAQGLKLDHRTDIYSLGIVLYEMATGQLPFNADDIGALLLQQVKQAPAPPRLINSDLSMTLEGVILKALEKNPVRRYQSAGAMATALADAVPGAVTIDTDTQMKRPPGLERLTETAQKETAPARKRLLRIILADDHTLLRRSLASMLEVREDFVVVAEASDAESAFQQTVSILPDVLILDLNMPGRGGLDVLPDIRRDAPDVKVLVLTGREEEAYIVRALKAGAHGYMLKSSDESELVDAITKVARGELALGSGVTEKMVGGIVAPESSNLNKLSEQDQKILLHVAAGMDNEAIAQRMNISLIDVIEALADLMNRLNAKDRYAVALLALREGYILLDDLQDLNASL